MIEKKTKLEKLEVLDTSIQARFVLLLEEDGTELSRQYHRTTFEVGTVLKQCEAVNAHLEAMKYPPISEADQNRIEQISEAAWKI